MGNKNSKKHLNNAFSTRSDVITISNTNYKSDYEVVNQEKIPDVFADSHGNTIRVECISNNVELVIYCKSITMNKGVHLNPKGHILFSPYKDAQNSSLLKALAWSICKNLAFALMFSVV